MIMKEEKRGTNKHGDAVYQIPGVSPRLGIIGCTGGPSLVEKRGC
jgi:hypothetical protein